MCEKSSIFYPLWVIFFYFNSALQCSVWDWSYCNSLLPTGWGSDYSSRPASLTALPLSCFFFNNFYWPVVDLQCWVSFRLWQSESIIHIHMSTQWDSITEYQVEFLCYTVSEWVSEVAHCVRLFATPWTVAYQAPPSMGFSRQEYWSGLPFPSPRDLPNPGFKPRCPAFQADALTSEPPGGPY